METFSETYFRDFSNLLTTFLETDNNHKNLDDVIDLMQQKKTENAGVFLIGNGGSAGIAEHMVVDLFKNAGLRAMSFSGTPLLTALSNDYGYDEAYQRCVERYANSGDVLIAISSSGTSQNIINAAREGVDRELDVITFSGFSPDNPLRQMGKYNFWLDSKSYGYVEIIHNLLIHYINDGLIGAAEYKIH